MISILSLSSDGSSYSDPGLNGSAPGMTFLGIACKTGNIETIKWIINSMNMKPSGNNDPESQEIPLLHKIYDLFFIGIGQENEIPPISVATNPALDFLLHEGI